MDINNLLGENAITVLKDFEARMVNPNHRMIGESRTRAATLRKGHVLIIQSIRVRIKFYEDYLADKNNATFCEITLHCESETDDNKYVIDIYSYTELHLMRGHERFVLYAQDFKKNLDSKELKQRLEETRIPLESFSMS